MGQIRGNTRTRVRGSYKDTGRVGRARTASVWINRRKGCEYKEKEGTECEEEHYIMKVRTVDNPVCHRCTPGRTSVPKMTTSTAPNSDQRRETVDVSLLREIARNSLVHALNSVSRFPSLHCVTVVNFVGQRCKDTRVRPISGRTT